LILKKQTGPERSVDLRSVVLRSVVQKKSGVEEREVRAKIFVKSMHVGHLRAHPADYSKAAHDFLLEFHFSKLM
jgi:hypothetical protein